MDTETAPPDNRAAQERPRGPFQDAPDRNAWFGDPPDIHTAQRWLMTVQDAVQRVQTELSSASQSLPVYEDDGTPVAPVRFPTWRRSKLEKLDVWNQRIRGLKHWMEVNDGQQLTDGQRRSLAKDRDVPVHCMFAAARRLEMYHELYLAVLRWWDEDTDEHERAIGRCLDVLEQHGTNDA